MDRFRGRVAVVTGANSGIGAAIAEELVKKEVKVVGLDLSTSNKLDSGNYYALQCDVTKEEEVKEVFHWIKSNLGGVDILVNNAGCAPLNTLIDGPSDAWRQTFNLNVLALSICSKEAIQSMNEKKTNNGHIININSVSGHRMPLTYSFLNMYAVSKHAVKTITEGLRREIIDLKTKKIRISSVSPSLVNTGFLQKECLDFGIYLEPKNVADAVLYVLGTPQHVSIHELSLHAVGTPH